MSLIAVSKAIRIDERALIKIEATQRLLDNICEELEEIVQEDDYFSFLLESGERAAASIKDFMSDYAKRNQ